MKKKFIIGVDVGGTNVKLGLINFNGRIISRTRLLTKKYIRSKKRLIEAIIGAINSLIKGGRLTKRDISGIGFGLPGLINSKDGIVNFLPNVPGWKNVPLRNIIQKKLHIPVFLDNDVNLIALGEWKFGAGKGYKNLIYVTLGTGVGSGLILNNNLYRGEGFAAGELGHMPLNEKGLSCSCGGFGCLERYVGNQHLLKKASKIFKNKKIQLEDIFTLANKGNARAIKFWNEAAVHIGNGLVGVVNLLNPQMIVFGGGVSKSYRFLHKTILAILKKRAMRVQGGMVKISRAKLGDDAGIIGAYVLVKDMISGS